MNENGYLKKISILFFVGALIGIVLAYAMKDYYINNYYNYFEIAAEKLVNGKIHYGLLFFRTMERLVIPYLLVLSLCLSPAWIAFAVGYFVYLGFNFGYFIQSIFLTYHIKGLLYCILYGMPQIIIYVPAMLMLVYLANQVNMNPLKKKGFIEKLLPFGIILFMLAVGACLETFINPFIMRKVIFLVS